MLAVQDPDGTRTTHPFRHPRMGVGRKPHNDLALNDQAISSEHCEFVNERGWLVVRDLSSANGTFVNGRRISEARLRNGDEVKVGGTRIAVAVHGRTGPAGRRFSWFVASVVLLALAFVGGGVAFGVFWHARTSDAEGKARDLYATEVRALVQADACGALDAGALSSLDARIGSRSVALQMSRGSVALTVADRQTDVELLGLYREKIELYERALAALSTRQQEQRDGLEKTSRLGARFKDSKDRKVAFWAEAQLNERVAKGDDFGQGLRAIAAETKRFVSLIEAVAVRNEAAYAAQLAHFSFATDLRALLRSCQEESARTQSGALAALNALDD